MPAAGTGRDARSTTCCRWRRSREYLVGLAEGTREHDRRRSAFSSSTITRRTCSRSKRSLTEPPYDLVRAYVGPRRAAAKCCAATSPSSCSTSRCPDIDGYETAELIRGRERSRGNAHHLPHRQLPQRSARVPRLSRSAPSTTCSSRSPPTSCGRRSRCSSSCIRSAKR